MLLSMLWRQIKFVLLRLKASPLIFSIYCFLQNIGYDRGMVSLEQYVENLQAHGKLCFSREDALQALELSEVAWSAAATRLVKKQRLASPHRGFYLILRPEDRVSGAPDPARWVAQLMRYLRVDYRVSLLRSAAFHGSSHQAAMVFQLVVPKQLQDFELGRHRVQFVYQQPEAFAAVNRLEWLDAMKSDTGYVQVAGVELTLLDSMRYFHKAAGINGVAQLAKDIGKRARPAVLSKVATYYESTTVRRLGYLLELAGHERQASALAAIAAKAKSLKPLDPSAVALLGIFTDSYEVSRKWMLNINEVVEFDF